MEQAKHTPGRCNQCGGALPITRRLDRAGECSCSRKVMSTQYTEGPWGTHFHPSHGHCITQVNEYGSPMPNDIAVVFMAGNSRTREQCKADARLIASAPDLLRVAELLVDWLDEDEGAHKLCDAARAAIAKATGSAA